MAAFAKLTKIEWNGAHSVYWANLDHVHGLVPTDEGAELLYADGRIRVAESPEHIAFMAAAEYPQPVR